MVQAVENNEIINAKAMLQSAFKELQQGNYNQCEVLTKEAQDILKAENSNENISICLSLIGFVKYLKDTNNYQKALTYLNDALYLANYNNYLPAQLVYELFSGVVNFKEKNIDLAEAQLVKAKYYAVKDDEFGLMDFVIKYLDEIAKLKNQEPSNKRDPLNALVKISQSVAAETDINKLLKVIAEAVKETINADRCTVFLYDKEHDELWSKVALGLESSELRFPAGKGLAGYTVKSGESINIKDAYNDERFNKDIDMKTGYKTKTILCMPIKNLNQEIIGAFQVLNKIGGYFTPEDEDLLVAIGSSAGIALENAQLFEKQKKMLEEQKVVFDSFIETLAASIDARDKITAGHSTRVKYYSSMIAKAFNMEPKQVEIIEKAATLHDIGKIGIKDSVLQKEGKLTDDEYKQIQRHVEITHNILEKIHMSDDFKMIAEIACAHHEKFDGTGYYRYLSREDIPFGGRILAVADVFDAITSKRHYRDKMPIRNVINILIKDSDKHFDRSVVDKFLSLPTNQIIKVFLTENKLVLKPEDEEFLSRYNLRDLYNLLEKDADTLSEEETKFVTLFNKYYLGQVDD